MVWSVGVLQVGAAAALRAKLLIHGLCVPVLKLQLLTATMAMVLVGGSSAFAISLAG